jgi:glycosyltransferase involved in cell wall biosynthesis
LSHSFQASTPSAGAAPHVEGDTRSDAIVRSGANPNANPNATSEASLNGSVTRTIDMTDTSDVPDAADGPDQPRCVMLVANRFTHDTRVAKEAESVASLGMDVHVIALAGAGLPEFEPRGAGGRTYSIHRIKPGNRLAAVAILLLARWTEWPLTHRLEPDDTPFVRPRSGRGPGRATAARQEPKASPSGATSGAAQVAGLKRKNKKRKGRPPLTHRVRAIVNSIKNSCHRALRWAALRVPNTGVVAAWRPMISRALSLHPDILHANDLNTLPAGAVVARRCGSGLVYDSHELWLHRNIGSRSRFVDRLAWGRFERSLIGRCDAVISVAAGICEWLARKYGVQRPHLVRNAQPYEALPKRGREIADRIGLTDDAPICLYAGVITSNRGLESLIEAAVHMPGVHIVIMGYATNPEYEAGLRSQARANGTLDRVVHFLPAVPREDLLVWTASADLSVVPTQGVCMSYRFEASNKIFQSLMAGVPLAMSDHEEKRMLVEEWGVGVLFDERDPKAIADSVLRCLADREGMARMREKCLLAARTLNWEHEEATLLSIYRGLLEARRAAGAASSPGHSQMPH